jgi:hypothetical protein
LGDRVDGGTAMIISGVVCALLPPHHQRVKPTDTRRRTNMPGPGSGGQRRCRCPPPVWDLRLVVG